MTRYGRRILLAVVALVTLAACADGDDVDDQPGAGIEVTIARPTWSTGWYQAEVYANLLRRLGYEVNEPEELELTQAEFYEGAARGEIDMWANGWFPGDESQLDRTIDGVGRIGDLVEPIGFEVRRGALAGILIDRRTALAETIQTLGDIADDPELIELFDTDENGRAEILGCSDELVCAEEIDALISDIGADVFEQVRGDVDEHRQVTQRRVEAGEPVLLYAWTPTATVEVLALGEVVTWLDTSPAGSPESVQIMEPGQCTRAQCRMGFDVNDIRVAANAQFLDDNPAAAALLRVVRIPLDDIQAQNREMLGGADSPDDLVAQVDEWLGARRGEVLDWLRTARRAAADS